MILNRKYLLSIFVLAFMLFVAWFWQQNAVHKPIVRNFQECAAAGYPVMESYPRQCKAPGTQFYVEQLIPEPGR